MTGADLLTAVGYGVRDPQARTYPLRERFVYLQEGVKAVAQELARRRSAAVAASVQVTATNGRAARPSDCLAVYAVADAAGNELPMGEGEPFGWRVEGGDLVLAPAPDGPVSLTLVYAARPALAGLPIPADDAAACAAAAGELPFQGRLDLALTEFVKLRCLNRNEYDVATELGLYRLLLSQAVDLVGGEDLGGAGPVVARYDFSGGAA